ncbi:unannotated protein [freshwater metagenome]|uniref:Unannotated protein n=2 Tax=freshwater metagenome TaxID=449393 RepID=A0A6J5Z7M3_9ZZZZ|nr:polyisoprenoid-binding protein [Actinomycetota bacterium]
MTDPIASHTWTLVQSHSTAAFSVRHMLVANFRASFDNIDATLTEVDGQISLSGKVRTDAIVIKDQNLYGHLQSPEFFDTENTPEISFVSSSVTRDGEKAEVVGDLTIKGITHSVTASGHITDAIEDAMGNTKRGVGLETKIDRTAFGLDWNAPLPKGGFALSNDVKLTIDLEFIAA